MGEPEYVTQIPPSALKKHGYAMIKDMPCKLTDIIQKPKATANGNEKLHLIGVHIFTGKKYEDIFNLTAGFSGLLDVPVVSFAEFQLLDVDDKSGALSLLTATGETKEDANLGRAENGKDFDDVGREVCRLYEAGESVQVVVMTAMGKDVVQEVRKE
eukprot:gnl/TRDRNA2_/TRDRNA2_126206_c0_seq1.p2 gnl/TRDRNA2_/TRDRNA2_126206_c0~~gnl/TRDRNA2_/TRDRNA2_126206_c0_seq1.p2  ORF type:complete len:174 (+),score=42.80 gnl/TRDRNA2_/TRDRNA2_126206_c0_seq1:54-524(+)